MKILWLSEEDVASLLTVADAIDPVEKAFTALGGGNAQMPPKVYLSFPQYNGDLRAMPAFLPSGGDASGKSYAAVKVVNSHPDNPSKGLPTVAAVLVLNNPENGMPLALMGAGNLTDARTGAAGAVAAKWLARRESSTLGLVGCGRQARTQLAAILKIFPIKEVRVAGRSEEEAQEFCRHAKHEGIALLPCHDIQSACNADIVVTTTPSRRPLVKAEWIRPGTHINAIGADAPGKQELESSLLLRARVFVDLAEQAFHSGEVNVPLARGELKAAQIAGQLGDVISGVKKGRITPDEITIFDSTGLAVQDVAVAAWVFERALKEGKGSWLVF